MSKETRVEQDGAGYEVLGEAIRLPGFERALSARETLSEEEFMEWLNARLAIVRAEGRLQEVNEAHQRLVGGFWQRYGLGEKDEIRPNGTIVRVAREER